MALFPTDDFWNGLNPPIRQFERSWNSNGVRYSVQAATFNAWPAQPRRLDSHMVYDPFDKSRFFSTALGFLGDVLAARSEQFLMDRSHRNFREPTRRQSSRVPLEYDADREDDIRPRRQSHVPSDDRIAALQSTIEHHERILVETRRDYEYEVRRRRKESKTLSGLRREISHHTEALQNVQANLLAEQDRERRREAASGRAQEVRPTPLRRSSIVHVHSSSPRSPPVQRAYTIYEGGRNDRFAHASFFATGPSVPHRNAFERSNIFAGPEAEPHHRGSAPGGVPPRMTRSCPSAQAPPATMLTPHEAKRIFERYDSVWESLLHSDSAVPYPCRGLISDKLSDRSTLWARNVYTSLSEWSEETVMRANVQAFFLGAVGLQPQYTETNGRIGMGFDKVTCPAAKMTELVNILKNEKKRWHSDRLGRRNNGLDGVNENLQRDDRARAVFHAVCDLMQFAQSSA